MLDNASLLLLGTQRRSPPQGEVGEDADVPVVVFGVEEGEAAS